ncbi:hypothetical protein A7A08_00751 [Methyloligella halotolerans]|uniref:Uncharacterized protein n=2 Tax=Methyloligella halotolerans TaxID=1177755 RepID=A0A1E2S330_9HYPH|nr:hypothetical protein A7A08_00751 [Methyloligella halotolerans]
MNAETAACEGGRQEDYAKIETALQQTPRGRWFLAEHARRNRSADTTLVLSAIERLERVVKGGAENVSGSASDPAGTPARSFPALPFARLKQDAETAARDVAAMEQASKDAAADILIATEAIQDFSWEMRDQGIDRKTCETIERHTADIYAACSFQDVVYQRKENAIHLLRLIAEALETALGGPASTHQASDAPREKDSGSGSNGTTPPEGIAEPDIPLAPEFVAEGDISDMAEVPADSSSGYAEAPTGEAQDRQAADQAGASSPFQADVAQRPTAGQDDESARERDSLDAAMSRLDATRLALLFG